MRPADFQARQAGARRERGLRTFAGRPPFGRRTRRRWPDAEGRLRHRSKARERQEFKQGPSPAPGRRRGGRRAVRAPRQGPGDNCAGYGA
eukprot:2145627-Alexandrium_andersonii.AAC.1